MDYAGFKATLQRDVYASVYLIFGDEPFLMGEIVETLTDRFASQPGGEFNIDRLEGDATAESIAEAAQTPPFMAERRLVIVRDTPLLRAPRGSDGTDGEGAAPGKGKGASRAKAAEPEAPLLHYFASPSPTTCLVFFSPSGVDKRKRLYKTIEKAGQAVEIKKLSDSDLRNWAAQRATAMQLPFEAEALRLLVDRVGDDLGRLVLEMEKLRNFLGEPSPKRRVTPERVRRLVPATPEDNVFAIADALGDGRVDDALRIARDLVRNGQHPIPLLFLIIRHVRQLLRLKELAATGLRKNDWAREMKLPAGIVRKLESQADRFPREELRRLYHRLTAADVSIKTGAGEAQQTLELCLLAFAGEGRPLANRRA
ncbi:DNA polymerase III subunit delta [Heliobacterium gestii]|uniref:DNA polymerase III subunit delta n=1 Tax=Heliomicrobium gestii TaxID=2699 RepID=A0A845LLN0_HELGE|nr:DNA polymerase III subunit delta [Heliomicrobium gestii]MBM7868017.1 DNA polymerase-3 subunit delta [Heliomicrobium gestii]MZP44283.1 DNA polymerase III subunit delta [Heliomicrobium gestii]